MNHCTTPVQPYTEYGGTEQEYQRVNDCETCFLPVLEALPFVQEEPKDAAKTVGKPISISEVIRIATDTILTKKQTWRKRVQEDL